MACRQVDAVAGLTAGHHFLSGLRTDSGGTRPRSVRLAKEVASLDSLLPMNESSSVFVRVDEQQVGTAFWGAGAAGVDVERDVPPAAMHAPHVFLGFPCRLLSA